MTEKAAWIVMLVAGVITVLSLRIAYAATQENAELRGYIRILQDRELCGGPCPASDHPNTSILQPAK